MDGWWSGGWVRLIAGGGGLLGPGTQNATQQNPKQQNSKMQNAAQRNATAYKRLTCLSLLRHTPK